MNTTLLDELSRIDCVKGQTGKGKQGLTALSSRRAVVADALAECPVRAWISTDEFLRFLRASGNDFSVTRNAWNLYIGELQYGSLGYENGKYILDERYLLCLLLEYTASLGLVDVALIPPAGARYNYGGLWGTDELVYFSRYDGLMYFRVTPLGAHCLGAESGYEPAPVEVKPVLRVLPNLEIAAIGAELEPGDRLALDAYATKVSDLVWRLDAGKLLAAIEEGRPVTEIREFLAARSGAPIPHTVARLIEDVSDRSAKVQDPRPRSLDRMRRSRARRAHRQRLADAQALHASRGTAPGSAGVLGGGVQARPAGARLPLGHGRGPADEKPARGLIRGSDVSASRGLTERPCPPTTP